MLTSIQEIEKLIENSDKILIGIGEEFSCNKIDLKGSKVYQEYLGKLEDEEDTQKAAWLIEPIKKHYINFELDLEESSVFKAYKRLFKLMKEKDYFIVSMNSDSLLETAGFLTDRLVYPCGKQMLYQCSKNCTNQVWRNEDIDKSIIQQIMDRNVKLSNIERPVCKNCGEDTVYNEVGKQSYCETGYLSQWEKYTDWTAHTLNQSLCILELGVGFLYPSVIRWPFEKISFINNKANFVRVNEKFQQVSSDLVNKSITIKMNAIDFLLQ